jgi:hypothetical protein
MRKRRGWLGVGLGFVNRICEAGRWKCGLVGVKCSAYKRHWHVSMITRYSYSIQFRACTSESTMDPLNLFRVDGMVAVVTGGGTGTFSLSLSLSSSDPNYLVRLHSKYFRICALPSITLPQTSVHYTYDVNLTPSINPKRLNLALAA